MYYVVVITNADDDDGVRYRDNDQLRYNSRTYIIIIAFSLSDNHPRALQAAYGICILWKYYIYVTAAIHIGT